MNGFKVAVYAAFAALVASECPNGCSGRGLCKTHDQCECEPNYYGADCSLRVCPSDYAFVDVPAGDLNHDGTVNPSTYVALSLGEMASTSTMPAHEMFPVDAGLGGYAAQNQEAHFYMECSGKGTCDKSSGQCKCFSGYTGAACQRSTCANDCSGHGLCRTLREVAAGALSRRAIGSTGGNLKLDGVREPFDYSLWDADKHQMCVCDAGYEGSDCSQRSCPRGDDPLTPNSDARWCGGQKCVDEIQSFTLTNSGDTTYRFTWIDLRNDSLTAYATVNTANGIPGHVKDEDLADKIAAPSSNAGIIMNALRSIPGGKLQFVEVRAMADDTDEKCTFEITFAGVSGNQYMIDVAPASGAGRVRSPPTQVVAGNTEDIECSGRGLCDRDLGLCKCFMGYYGVACEHQNALSGTSKKN